MGGEVFDDPLQGVRGLFMTGRSAGLPRLELPENLPGSATLSTHLARGIRIYHMGFAAADFEEACRCLTGRCHALMVAAPRPCTCFARICFMALPNAQLIEIIEP